MRSPKTPISEPTRAACIGRSAKGSPAIAQSIISIDEYVRGDAHTNTVEGYFSIFKRGIYGVYHHVSQDHLKRYLCEFDFRYNYRVALGFTDMQRTEIAAAGIYGKHLTYRRIGATEHA
jgi:hypothetical protein